MTPKDSRLKIRIYIYIYTYIIYRLQNALHFMPLQRLVIYTDKVKLTRMVSGFTSPCLDIQGAHLQ